MAPVHRELHQLKIPTESHVEPFFCQEQNVSCETIARRVVGSGDHVQGTRENGNFSKNLNLAAAPAIRYLGQRWVLGVQLFSPNDRQGVPLQASSVSDCEVNHEDRIFQTYPAYGSGCTDRCLDAAGYVSLKCTCSRSRAEDTRHRQQKRHGHANTWQPCQGLFHSPY